MGEAPFMRGVAAGRSAQRACERSSDWRRGAAGSPDPDAMCYTSVNKLVELFEPILPEARLGQRQ